MKAGVAAAVTEERVYRPADRLDDDPLFLFREHLDRYAFAAKCLEPGWRVLDAACGSGYGTELLCQAAAAVTGLDVDPAAIEFARENHRTPNADYLSLIHI